MGDTLVVGQDAGRANERSTTRFVPALALAAAVSVLLAALAGFDFPFDKVPFGSLAERWLAETVREIGGGEGADSADDGGAISPAFGQGRLVISALPWAEVVSVTDSEGHAVPLARPLYTPTLLSLPADLYQIELLPTSGNAQIIEVQVPITGTERRLIDFGGISAEAYFTTTGLNDWFEQAGSREGQP